jgi:hypothetical protein
MKVRNIQNNEDLSDYTHRFELLGGYNLCGDTEKFFLGLGFKESSTIKRRLFQWLEMRRIEANCCCKPRLKRAHENDKDTDNFLVTVGLFKHPVKTLTIFLSR